MYLDSSYSHVLCASYIVYPICVHACVRMVLHLWSVHASTFEIEIIFDHRVFSPFII